MPLQDVLWLGNLPRGDLGDSLVNDYPVARLIGQRLPVALELTVGALMVAWLIGGAAGITVGVRPRRGMARIVDIVNATAIAVPVFWLGLLLQIIVAKLGWLPASGYVALVPIPCLRGPDAAVPHARCRHRRGAGTLPRDRYSGNHARDFIVTARAKGLAPWRIVLQHVLRNAVIPP